MLDFLKKILGSKSEKDVKAIQPVLEASLALDPKIKALSNDELRQKTLEFRERIRTYIEPKEIEIAELRKKINSEDIDIEEKEHLYHDLDRLEKESYDMTQEVLNEIIPEAFAVIKDTARRFFENDYIEVTATQFDRDLAARRNSVEIVDDKARFHSKWLAGGNMIRWDMVHYDCQLIGGVVFDLLVPKYMPFDGQLHVYLPLVEKNR